MKKSLLCAALLAQLASCATCPTIPKSTDHCTAPAIPVPPQLNPGNTADGSLVTITVTESIALTKYIFAVAEARASLAGCSLVVWRTL